MLPHLIWRNAANSFTNLKSQVFSAVERRLSKVDLNQKKRVTPRWRNLICCCHSVKMGKRRELANTLLTALSGSRATWFLAGQLFLPILSRFLKHHLASLIPCLANNDLCRLIAKHQIWSMTRFLSFAMVIMTNHFSVSGMHQQACALWRNQFACL